MAIDKKLIHFQTWNKFISHGVGSEENITTPTSGEEDARNAIYGQIKGTSIVFIKDVGKIWTHGKVYGTEEEVYVGIDEPTNERTKLWISSVDENPTLKVKIDNSWTEIQSGSGISNIDDVLNETSVNPVQNRVITEHFEGFIPLSRDFSNDFNNDFAI